MAEIFQKALNMSIAAGWLILAVIALRLLLRRAPKRFRLLLWAVVGLRLALPWSIESALSLIPSAQTLPEGIMLERAPVLDTGISALNGAINPGFTAAFTPELGASANPLQVLLPIAAALWMLGAAAMLLWALVSWLRLRKRVREAVRLEENVYECEIASPFVLGLFRPRIYLPFSLENGERELVLAHERAHITAGDHIIKPLGWLLLAAHWYNPLVWLAYALFCRDIELACDERVVRGLSLSDRADYSQALLDLSRPRGGVRACPLAFGESSVKGRVKSVLNYKKPAFWLVLLAVVVCVGAAVCFLTDPNTAAEDTGEDESGRVAITTELDENFPEQVLYYAVNCTVKQVEMMIWLKVERAEITDLACYAETKGPDGVTLLLFKLGARYKLAEPESVMPVGGMLIEDGWLTRLDDGGDRYMLLAREGEDWRFIGLVTEQVLSEYGTDYDAAALGEYALAASSAPVISLAEGLEGLPEGLLDCACFCVQLQAGFSAYELTSVEITQLELAAEFDGPDGGTLCLYKLGSRGKLADADAMPAGGVQIADGWFNDGLLYMLLRRDGEDLSYIGVMHELTLDEMGGDYEAAALDLYGRVLAGGVTWSSNLAMSSLNAIQCRFEFNYNALDMRFSASCSEGQLESSGHTLIWTPEPDTAFAVVSFTLRDASGESVSGSIVITRIARSSEASSTYLASLACPGYVMEPLANGTGATIRAAE